MSVVLDASVLVAVQNPRDALHDSAFSMLDDAADRPWLLAPLTLTELLVGPARVGGEAAARQLMGWLVDLGVEVLPTPEVRGPEVSGAIELAVLRARTGLKLPDCVVLAAAVQEAAALATLDRRLAEAAAARGVEVLLPPRSGLAHTD